MRKFLLLFLAVAMFAVIGCGLKTDPQPPKKGNVPTIENPSGLTTESKT